MSLSDRALETQRLLLLLFHLQDTKHQSCVKGLSQGSTEGSKYNFGACLAYWDLKVGAWRSEKYETLHNVGVKTEYPVFLHSFIQEMCQGGLLPEAWFCFCAGVVVLMVWPPQ